LLHSATGYRPLVQVVAVKAAPVAEPTSLHHSITPPLHDSITPPLHHSAAHAIAANKTGEAKPSEAVEMVIA